MKTNFSQVRQGLIETYREGYKKRGISLNFCENDWIHTKRTTKACVSHVIGSPERIDDKKGFPLMGFGHDWTEWRPEVPDYTPGCNIDNDVKSKLESEELSLLRELLGTRYYNILDKVEEKQEGNTRDARELTYIDKSLPGIGGMDYDRLGYGNGRMDDFHPYAFEKLSGSKYHTRIYEILLEREFNDIDFFEQYFMLLEMGGDYDAWRKKMQSFFQ